MKVCFVTTAFPDYPGDGDAVFIWQTVRAVARQGAKVWVVAAHKPGLPHHEVMEGIEVIRPRYWLPERAEVLRKEVGGLPITWRKYPITRLQIFPFVVMHTLYTLRCAHNCDLIHAHWTLSAAAARLGRWLHRTPVLATVQGSDIFRVTENRVGAYLTRKVLEGCEAITALSNALAEATAAVGVPRERIHVVPNGVLTDQFTPLEPLERENTVLYVGSFIERKGVKYLLRAVSRIFERLPDYRLVLVGDGPQRRELEALGAELGIEERVEFLGYRPQDEVRWWMRRARLFVLPSLEEGLGVVLLEALASGTPIVASGVGGIVDVVTPEVGSLVPPAKPVVLAQAIEDVLCDEQRWRSMSEQARMRAINLYDWDRVGEQYVQIYQEVLARH